jgi:hypothetical protein
MQDVRGTAYASLRARVAVFIRPHINRLKTNDCDLAAFKERDPDEESKKDENLERRVGLRLYPRWVVPLLGDPVDHDKQGKDEQG